MLLFAYLCSSLLRSLRHVSTTIFDASHHVNYYIFLRSFCWSSWRVSRFLANQEEYGYFMAICKLPLTMIHRTIGWTESLSWLQPKLEYTKNTNYNNWLITLDTSIQYSNKRGTLWNIYRINSQNYMLLLLNNYCSCHIFDIHFRTSPIAKDYFNLTLLSSGEWKSIP